MGYAGGKWGLPKPNSATIESTQLLVDLFKASAELRFHIKSLGMTKIERNPSWSRHTEVMRKVESFFKTTAATSTGEEAG